MAKKVKKPTSVEVPITADEYVKFTERLRNARNFRKALSLEMQQKEAKDVKKLLQSYVNIFYKKGIGLKVVSERYRAIGGKQREFILAIDPLMKLKIGNNIVNTHYVIVKQEFRGGMPYVVVDFYLNIQESREVEQMDKILSVLAIELQKKGFRIIEEELARFEQRKR